MANMGVAASRNEMAVNSKRSLDTTVNLMSKRNVALSASESCWEGENCSYCKVRPVKHPVLYFYSPLFEKVKLLSVKNC